ncbi:hypothetical protein [Cryobacterium sp. PH31-O1]|uniref:hypothetical protein n=1 Tax=Cryobacterium sp. PH31-O1 TaxID=3046306 RepID=UPI0024BB3F6D|nr:hypothetical protein [Cryobacterium sp. PH31-O1]MDJ0337446.1 hypothetical protein [Cryobacterium sp. PH31-O1]
MTVTDAVLALAATRIRKLEADNLNQRGRLIRSGQRLADLTEKHEATCNYLARTLSSIEGQEWAWSADDAREFITDALKYLGAGNEPKESTE